MHEVLGGGEGILKIPTWQVSVLCGHGTRGLVVFVFVFFVLFFQAAAAIMCSSAT